MTAKQLTFDYPMQTRLGYEDFFVSDANRTAYAMICAPQTWPDGKLALIGPVGSGKTHLARIFAKQTGAQVIGAAKIDPTAPLPATAIVVEDCDTLAPCAEEWLFHAHNHLRATGQPFLVTGTAAPARWALRLPDLASRLTACTLVEIGTPDDPLLMAVLMKHFQDRQLAPAPEALAYLCIHLPRSFQAVREVVDALDREALSQSKALTRPFVRQVLDSLR